MYTDCGLRICELKSMSRSYSDQLKNVKYKMDIFDGKSPDCYYGCKFHSYMMQCNRDFVEQSLQVEFVYLSQMIRVIGEQILELRGNKWSF